MVTKKPTRITGIPITLLEQHEHHMQLFLKQIEQLFEYLHPN